MNIFAKFSRRAFLASQAAVAAVLSLPSSVSAATSVPDTAGATTASGPIRWDTADTAQLKELIGDRFRVRTADHGTFVLKLQEVEPVDSGFDRPTHLRRTEGLVAVFDSPDADAMSKLGDQMVELSHRRLGNASLFVGPTPMRNGRPVIELVLN